MFSRRTAWDLQQSDFARVAAARRSSGQALLDLVRSNPSECGLGLDQAAVLEHLRDERGLRYQPDPLGLASARRAVAEYYAAHNADVALDRVVLTASTSEAYAHLFHLLCDPGDEVLIAQPSYPLFNFLADLADVRLRPYRLFYDFGWWIDFSDLEQAINSRTRAVVVVHPNNPTGHATSAGERERLRVLCAERDIALIADEVFLDYGLHNQALTSFAAEPGPALSFVLSGLSKVLAMPQMKLSWIVANGPPSLSREALARLELIADTFLSVNTPAQLALPQWMQARSLVQHEIRARLQENLEILRQSGLDMLQVDAGWSAILRLPVTGVEPWAERLVAHGVLIHPGEFYGTSERGRVVLSLLVPPEDLLRGLEVVKRLVAEDAV